MSEIESKVKGNYRLVNSVLMRAEVKPGKNFK